MDGLVLSNLFEFDWFIYLYSFSTLPSIPDASEEHPSRLVLRGLVGDGSDAREVRMRGTRFF